MFINSRFSQFVKVVDKTTKKGEDIKVARANVSVEDLKKLVSSAENSNNDQIILSFVISAEPKEYTQKSGKKVLGYVGQWRPWSTKKAAAQQAS